MGRVSDLNERILVSLVREGQWEIDGEGRVWRTCVRKGRKGGGAHLVSVARRRAEHRLPNGYLQVRAEIDGKRICGGAHRLVWQYFKGDIPHRWEINHDNGLKDDNRPGNLLCGSAGENIAHAHAGGLVDQFGQKNPAAKLTDNKVAQIRLAYAKGGYTMVQLGERFGVTFQTISKIVRGQRRTKQGGPTTAKDQRHDSCDHDRETGRFIGKARAGRLLDGRTHDELPQVRACS